MTTLIPELPTPVPQSTDPVNFAARADALLSALPGFATAANAQAEENNQLNAAAAASAASAEVSAAIAQSSSNAAATSVAAGRFNAATTYALGDVAWSPTSGLIYRRIAAGKAATDPSADKANWIEVMNLPVGTEPNNVPSIQGLGALAFADVVGVTVVYRSPAMSRPGDVWREYLSDTTTTLKFHGFDGIVRSRAESWT
ncbi:hypothetical protein [Comamonas thiooxydans]|uniref:hypothetical protein n=1 Tax=Comamonas thiooxydans TaxID=363952 RepID=UPI00311E8E41